MKIKIIITLIILVGMTIGSAYAKKDKANQLPAGLQKKVEKGKPLPPGWQKKLAKGDRLGEDIYRQGQVVVPLDPHGLVTIRVEGKLLRLHNATREIIEILK